MKVKDAVKIKPGNRVTIPKEIRDKLGVGPGDEISFVRKGKIIYIFPKGKPKDKWLGF